jgi:hypothetical protein
LKTYGKGGVYVNFPGRAGEDSARATYPGEIYDRLRLSRINTTH